MRTLRRQAPLRPGLELSCAFTVGGKPSGRIDVTVQHDVLQLSYEWRSPESTVWIRDRQSVQITRTACHLGGSRCWFQCRCGRRAAKLYFVSGSLFQCRLCNHFGYRSQLENPRHRAITRARKLRMRLGAGPSLLDPLPTRPPRMHRRTFYRLFDKAAEAQERCMALALEDLRRRYRKQSED